MNYYRNTIENRCNIADKLTRKGNITVKMAGISPITYVWHNQLVEFKYENKVTNQITLDTFTHQHIDVLLAMAEAQKKPLVID